METNKVHKLRQELRKKLRAEEVYEKEDSKQFLKQAVLVRGGERLQKDIEQAQRQLELEQQLEDEQRAFSEMLARNEEE